MANTASSPGAAGALQVPANAAETPFAISREASAATPLDGIVLAALRERGIQPALLCSDAVFCRRAFLDVIGTLPQPDEARDFLENSNSEKRAALIDALMQRDEFSDYWTLKWCDVLRVKSEFPINLWPNAVQAYWHWIRGAMRSNTPYDQFARALLTSNGSNFRVPPVNFYRAVQGREPAGRAAAVALTFMGTRFELWPVRQREAMAAFFSKIAYKKTAEWKEEIVYPDPRKTDAFDATFPDGKSVRIAAGDDPRLVFTDWLVSKENPWFARAIVNRVWSWFFGRGIVHEPDDIRPDNPPAIPELLSYLERAFVTANFDLRYLFALILKSDIYQQSSVPRSAISDSEASFASYPIRRLDAEVLIDALCSITGTTEEYSSAIPEPFAYLPARQRSIALADGSTTSAFLEMFGRPARDTGLESERNNETSDEQRLYLLNSSEMQRRIERSERLAMILRNANGRPKEAIRNLYLTVLSRYPTPDEIAAVALYAEIDGIKPKDAADDLVWALINSKEFLYRH